MINEREQSTTEYILPQQAREYFVDATEAAKFLRVNRRTLLQMARNGIVPAHPLGEGARTTMAFPSLRIGRVAAQASKLAGTSVLSRKE